MTVIVKVYYFAIDGLFVYFKFTFSRLNFLACLTLKSPCCPYIIRCYYVREEVITNLQLVT